MSKFEIRYPWAGKQCGNCKHIDLTYSYMSCPPKYNCKCFNKPVDVNRTTCLEDEFGKPKEIAEKVCENHHPNKPMLEERVKKVEEKSKRMYDSLTIPGEGFWANIAESVESQRKEINKTREELRKELRENFDEVTERLKALEKYSDFLEGKTCYNTCENDWKHFSCSACGAYVSEYEVALKDCLTKENFKYCPNCGRKVVRLPGTDYRRYQDKIDVQYQLSEMR